MSKLIKKLVYNGTLTCLTGIHIGDNKESTDIGGVDSPVIRRRDNGQPYLPGSSIKGKMRSLLEQVHGINLDSKFKNEGHAIQYLFGALENVDQANLPSRILVRDAFLTEDSDKHLKGLKTTELPYTEVKFENVINRVKGTAEHPRQIERVPAGAVFQVQFVINIFDDNKEADFVKLLNMGVELLNNDYLGGSGSRGYGHVQIELEEAVNILEGVSLVGNQPTT